MASTVLGNNTFSGQEQIKMKYPTQSRPILLGKQDSNFLPLPSMTYTSSIYLPWYMTSYEQQNIPQKSILSINNQEKNNIIEKKNFFLKRKHVNIWWFSPLWCIIMWFYI